MSPEQQAQSRAATAGVTKPAGLRTPVNGITVSEVKGIPLERREAVQAAVIAGGSGLPQYYEAWVVPSRKPPAYSVRIVGPRGFYREIRFAGPETELEIEERVRTAVKGSSISGD